jgi:hypothetical protein
MEVGNRIQDRRITDPPLVPQSTSISRKGGFNRMKRFLLLGAFVFSAVGLYALETRAACDPEKPVPPTASPDETQPAEPREEGVAGGVIGAGVGGLLSHCPGGVLLGGLIGSGTGALAGAAVDANNAKKAANASAADAAARAPTLEDVDRMTQCAVPTGTIIELIRTSGVVYRLTPDQIIWLTQQGVQPVVVQAMQDTAYRRASAPAVVTCEPTPPATPVASPRGQVPAPEARTPSCRDLPTSGERMHQSPAHPVVVGLTKVLSETKSQDTFLAAVVTLGRMGAEAQPAVVAILRNGERLGVFEGAFGTGNGAGGQVVLEALAAIVQDQPVGGTRRPTPSEARPIGTAVYPR